MHTQQDKEEFVRLIEQTRGILYKVCHSFCSTRDELDDLAQEIVYQLWKSWPRYDPAQKFSTWMYRVALNVAISHQRRENKFKGHLPISEELFLQAEGLENHSEAEQEFGRVQAFINGLKEIDRSIMLLFLDDKSYREIAGITGISESNVGTRINRIREKLRTNFNK